MTKLEELLRAAAADPNATAWDGLYQEVCHQGECYPAGFFLMPHLAEIAAGFAPGDRDNVLIFAGQIAADLDEASRVRYADAIAGLRLLVDDWLATPADPTLFIYRLQALLALDGEEPWGKELDRIVDEEIEVECPTCGTSLFVTFGEGRHFATHEDYATKVDVERTPLLPAAPGELQGSGARLYGLSTRAGQGSVAEALRYVFGGATCTQCATTFRVSDQAER